MSPIFWLILPCLWKADMYVLISKVFPCYLQTDYNLGLWIEMRGESSAKALSKNSAKNLNLYVSISWWIPLLSLVSWGESSSTYCRHGVRGLKVNINFLTRMEMIPLCLSSTKSQMILLLK